ncbi:GNAT family N-acetyltransferase [uncultured Lamprocystis sp.]|jgi:GNAT superfamily N-acetyltransferase|uniref:GNAT family N-acetyltransferase n=1 Tax=uncultured Lamprocystis sp. TaxID=543132 RepID=UPI0025FCB12F|nr:GNAT family N-acetyltransferase [uncultured Lamprocystis sp.]
MTTDANEGGACDTAVCPADEPRELNPAAGNHLLLDLRLADAVAETVAVDAVAGTLRGLGLEAAVLDSMTAVCTQTLREARTREVFAGDRPTVEVKLGLHGHQVHLRVSDMRMPQWVEGAPAYSADQLARTSGLAGFRRGEQGNGGNWTECVAHLPAETSDGPSVNARDLSTSAQPPRTAGATAATVRLQTLSTDDAEGLVRLIYRVYGYTYPRSEFYSPEAIRRLLRAGEMSGIVAIDDAGELIGHLAAIPDTPYLTSEVGRLAVDPRYRGLGLASRLNNQLLQEARRAGTPALWAECVANHVASQRIVVAAGGVEVGLLLGAFPSTLRMSHIANPLDGRMSLVPMVLSVAPGPLLTAHLPAHLEPIYRQITGKLGLQRAVDTGVNYRPAGILRLRTSMLPQLNVGLIAADELGSGGLARVRAEMAAMISAHMVPIYLDIPVADTGAARAITLAYQHGFIWGMLFPCARADGDVLRLQWLGHQAVDTRDIQCATEHGRAMQHWVVGELQHWKAGAMFA